MSFAAPIDAAADTVVLNDGQRFEGAVEETEDEVRIELDLGTIAFSKADVDCVESSETPVREFNRRYRSIEFGDVSGLQKLADWAAQEGLPNRAQGLHLQVLAIASDNVRSRRALGHERRDGKWVDPDAEAQALLAEAHRRLAAQARREIEAEEAARRRAAERVTSAPAPVVALSNEAPGPWGWGLWYQGFGFAPAGTRRPVGRLRRGQPGLRRGPLGLRPRVFRPLPAAGRGPARFRGPIGGRPVRAGRVGRVGGLGGRRR